MICDKSVSRASPLTYQQQQGETNALCAYDSATDSVRGRELSPLGRCGVSSLLQQLVVLLTDMGMLPGVVTGLTLSGVVSHVTSGNNVRRCPDLTTVGVVLTTAGHKLHIVCY